MKPPAVGFIGLGTMGWPMARNIHGAGYDLMVYDSNAATARRFAEETGCRTADSITAMTDRDTIVTMLPDGDIVREVLTRGDGRQWLENARRGTLVIDMSSSEPNATRELGGVLAEHGISLIDAPVSGARVRAADATLTLMIGSDDPSATARARPLLESMGSRLFETGGLGCGHAAKALNNYVAASAYAATAEACLIAERFGLDRHTLMDILNVSTGRSFISEVVMKDHVLDEQYATGFALGLLTKDVRIAATLGQSVGLDAPVLRLVHERWELASRDLGDAADHSEAIRSWAGERRES